VAPDLPFCLFTRWADAEVPGVRAERIASPLAPFNRGSGAGAQLDKLLWEIGSLPAAAALRRAALVHSPTFAAPALATCPVVVTVHDLIPLVLPGYYRSPRAAYYSRLMAVTVPKAQAIITVSEHAKSDIVRILHVPPDRITVTPEAADERFTPDAAPGDSVDVRERYALPPRSVLYLGGGERRKNVETLVRAWASRIRELRAMEQTLVIAGHLPAPDALYPDIRGLIRELGLTSDVLLIDRVDEADKPAVYRSATLFCFPSRYEGFGLTPLEAMACGVPVICSNATSLPEVVGDAARLLPPDDPEEWGAVIVETLSSPQTLLRMRESGLARAGHFSWVETARQTAQLYRAVLGR
jgi:glycosyltransferase involved in cell wall biosynthesis